MRLSTLIGYLLGRRQAIVDIASCRGAVWLGLLFVLSAGFAREYDGEDLLHEPWHIFLPLAASLFTSFLLFSLVELTLTSRSPRGGEPDADIPQIGFLRKYRSFLGLYWMTAPLAWLYAIPVERFLAPADAVRANLWLLFIVSVWRVALMTRVVSVLYERSAVAAFFVVMLFADTVAGIISWFTPVPIMAVMSGIRLTESEQLIASVGFLLLLSTAATWLIWAFGVFVISDATRARAPTSSFLLGKSEPRPVGWPLWALAAVSLLVWIGILPFTQVEQRNRRRVEFELQAGRIAEAIDFMSHQGRDAFPPHWEPPPRFGYRDKKPRVIDILLEIERAGAPDWISKLYREKLAVQSRYSDAHRYWPDQPIQLSTIDDAKLAEYARLLATLPEGTAMAKYHEQEIRIILQEDADDKPAHPLTDSRRSSLQAISDLNPSL